MNKCSIQRGGHAGKERTRSGDVLTLGLAVSCCPHESATSPERHREGNAAVLTRCSGRSTTRTLLLHTRIRGKAREQANEMPTETIVKTPQNASASHMRATFRAV
jgi:hypothetical protein